MLRWELTCLCLLNRVEDFFPVVAEEVGIEMITMQTSIRC